MTCPWFTVLSTLPSDVHAPGLRGKAGVLLPVNSTQMFNLEPF